MQGIATGGDFALILAIAWASAVLALLGGRLASGRLAGPDARQGLVVMLGLWLAAAAGFAWLAIARHHALHTHAFDLGVFDQVVWNTARGQLFVSTIMDNVTSLLGNHFAPIILLVAPIAWLWDGPEALLVLQALALTGAAVPVYLVARDRWPAGVALLWGAAYLLYPPVLYVNLYDWHEIALVPPFLGFAAWFMLRRRYWPMLAMLAIALLAREEVGLIVAAFGLYAGLVQRSWRLGAGLVAGGVAYTAIATLVLIPFFGGASTGEYLYLDRYAYLGTTPGEMLVTLLTRPLYILEHVVVPDKLIFLGLLFVPLALLSLAGIERLLLAAPTIAYTLLSNDFAQYDITSQYHAPLAPLLFVAAIGGAGRLERRLGLAPVALAVAVLAGTLASTALHSPAPLSRSSYGDQFVVSERAARLPRIAAIVPGDASLAAQDHLVPHVARRDEVYMYPWINSPDPPDYLLVDLEGGSTYPFPSRQALRDEVAALVESGRYTIVHDEAGFQVLRRAGSVR